MKIFFTGILAIVVTLAIVFALQGVNLTQCSSQILWL